MEPSVGLLNRVLLRRQDNSEGSNPQQGKARNTSNSLSGLISTLVPVFIYATIFFTLFLILRRIARRRYLPRTYLGTLRKEELSPELPRGLFSWIGPFFKIPDTYVLNHHSLDGYLLLRFLKISVAICFFGCLITWPVLFPVNITGGGGGDQLDMLSFSNVEDKKRYYAHALISCVLNAFILYMVTRESIFYINLRQAYVLSPLFANRLSSRTVLLTSVPEVYLDEVKIRQIFGPEVRKVWIASDTDDVEDCVEERDKVALKLEAAETKLIRLANGARLKGLKKSADAAGAHAHGDDANAESGSVAARWVPEKKRPTHRPKFFGKKVDTINWSRSELQRLLPEAETAQRRHIAGEAKLVGAVFVEFASQRAAQDAYQTVAHHQPLHMAPRYIGVRPDEIIWKNLRIKWWERIVRLIATTAFVVAMIIFWAIPISFVASISNIDSLTERVSFLSFINDIPDAVLGVVTGLLPSVLVAILIALVPHILRLMAKIGGAVSDPEVELLVQNYFFAFQVLQVFLVTTLASTAAAAVDQIINEPGSTPRLLAENLPKASNFYISYFILQGLTISTLALLQLVPLIINFVLDRLFSSTPRKIYERWSKMKSLPWGTVFPIFTLLTVISITYSCIAPLVLGFGTIGLYLIYLAYRYNMLFVFNSTIDTNGRVYARALQQLLTGVYLSEICLIGLFGIRAAPGPLIIEVILLVFTVLYHASLNAALSPLLKAMPRTLAVEEEHLLAIERGGHAADADVEAGVAEPLATGKTANNGTSSSDKAMRVLDAGDMAGMRLASPVKKKPNFFVKWLRPDRYCDYRTLRRLVPIGFTDVGYTAEQERNAYYHPSIAKPVPLLWVPRDEGGVSRHEVRETAKFIPITDDAAWLNEKNKIVTDHEERPPIHEDPVVF